MPHPVLAPAPALFDVTTLTDTGIVGTLARLPIGGLELAATRARRSPPTASSASLRC
jgi:hypothetical protein